MTLLGNPILSKRSVWASLKLLQSVIAQLIGALWCRVEVFHSIHTGWNEKGKRGWGRGAAWLIGAIRCCIEVSAPVTQRAERAAQKAGGFVSPTP